MASADEELVWDFNVSELNEVQVVDRKNQDNNLEFVEHGASRAYDLSSIFGHN